MSKKHIGVLALLLTVLALASILLAACARPGSSPVASGTPQSGNSATSGGGGSNQEPTVHMNLNNFVQPTVTVPKGSKLKFVDDAQVPHTLKNGMWDNNTQKPSQEPGAPTVDASFQGKDTKEVGPFTTAGTFHIFCTIHLGMNLAVTVT